VRHFLGFVVLQSVLVAGLLAAYFTGLLSIAWTLDPTRLSLVIVVAFLVGLVAVAMGKWDLARWVAPRLFQLGLVGTIVGFIIAFSSIDASRAGDPTAATEMVTNTLLGMGVALMTTLVGALGNLWLSVNIRILE